VQQNYEQARDYFEKAAKQGDAAAMSNLGHMYAQGLGIPQDNATARQYFEDGVKRGNAAAKNGLGYLYMYGVGVEPSYKLANQYFTQAAESGNPEAQFNLGAMQIAGLGMKRDHSKAVHYFTLAAQQGHIIALYNLGLMHLNGMGTPRSCQVAVQLLKSVAERGPLTSSLTNATSALAEEQVEHALKLFELSGEVGFEIAQANAAWILDSHEGLPEGEKEHYGQFSRALRWYRRSAQQANVPSELRLGDYYYYGLGCEVDMKKAAAHYRTAGELRNPQAMFNMGFMYQLGLGVPQDFHLAKRYYDLAAETSSKAFLPASLAVAALFLHSLHSEYAWLVGDDIENIIIVCLSTVLMLVVGAIMLRRALV
jgi:TPR repeat protein